MKSTLLTTTALIAFAGAAAAEVTFTGSATLGYNDEIAGDNDGFYWEGNVAVDLTQELDNGLTAGVAFNFDFDNEAGDYDVLVGSSNDYVVVSGGYLLSLESETAGLFFGDTAFAAETHWASAGDMEVGFSEADGEVVLRGDVTMSGVSASISYMVADSDGLYVSRFSGEDVDQLSVGVAGSFGQFTVVGAYQEESNFSSPNGDFVDNEVFGLSVGAAFGGADITVAYAQKTGIAPTADESSLGVQVAYPMGPVTATVYYVSEDDVTTNEDNYGVAIAYEDGPIAVTLDYDYDQGVQKVGLDGSYDLGNGLTLLAGVYDQSDDAVVANNGTDYYVAGSYDMGGGASLLVSYAEADTGGAIADDEVGAPDYQAGTTVEVAFTF